MEKVPYCLCQHLKAVKRLNSIYHRISTTSAVLTVIYCLHSILAIVPALVAT